MVDQSKGNGAKLARPTRATAGDQAEQALFDAIMAGRLPPGTHLRLNDLASDLGMSIMPVREALRRLEGLGLVDIEAHKGARVRPMTLDDLCDTYFTRLHHETLAVWTAAPRFSEADAQQAKGLLKELDEARKRDDTITARNVHEQFHFGLYRASGSDWLLRSIAPAWRNSERYRVESMRDPGHLRRRAREHRQMVEALERHDGDAVVSLLVEHLRSSAELVAARLGYGSVLDRLPSVEDLMLPAVAVDI